MVLALATVAGLALFSLAVLGADRLARARNWRLGSWTQRMTAERVWRIETRWGVALIHGGCEKCGTSWRYVDPFPLAVSPYGKLAVLFPFCGACHSETPHAQRHEMYLSWWLDRRDAIAAEGGLPPDVREWQEVALQLDLERSPNRIVAA